MAEPLILVPNLNGMVKEYTAGEEEVHLEPQTKTIPVIDSEVQKGQNQTKKGKRQRRAEESRTEQARETKDNEAFISNEAYAFWEENLSDKGFIGERGFGTFISPFTEMIEKRG